MRKIVGILTLFLAATALGFGQGRSLGTIRPVQAMCWYAGGSTWLPVAAANSGMSVSYVPDPVGLFGQNSGTYYSLNCDSGGNLIVSGGSTATEFANELGSVTLSPPSANGTHIYTIWFPYSFASSKITYRVATADNTTDLYDIGFYTASGSLICHVGATLGTTFAPAAGSDITLPMLQTCTFTGGTRYIFAITGNAATGTLAGTNRKILPNPGTTPATGGTTTGGVLNSTITYGADAWSDGTGNPFISLHN